MKKIKSISKKQELFYRIIWKFFFQFHAKKIIRYLEEILYPGMNCLDIGSGDCLMSQKIREVYHVKMQCIDIVNCNITDLPFKIYNGKKLPFRNKSFEAIFLNDVCHHCVNTSMLLKEAIRVSKKYIIVSECISRSSFSKKLLIFSDLLFALYFPTKIPLNFKSVEEWKKEFFQQALKLVKIYFFRDWYFPTTLKALFILKKNNRLLKESSL